MVYIVISCKKIASQKTKVREVKNNVKYIIYGERGISSAKRINDSSILEYWLRIITRTSPNNLINGLTAKADTIAPSVIATS